MRPRSAEDREEMLAFASLIDRSAPARGYRSAQAQPEVRTGYAAEALTAAEELAAVSGRFDPAELAALVAGPEQQTALLSGLKEDCSMHPESGGVRWLLRPANRTAVLGRLLQETRLETCLQQALPSTDAFGEMLRRVFKEKGSLDPESITTEALPELAAALEASANLNFPKPDSTRVQQLLAQSRFLAEHQVLLKDGFYGRTKETTEFEEFLAGVRGDHLFHNTSALIVTGLGGAGKSTFMAKMADSIVKDQSASVVILDFDRPGINPSDTYWLEMEIARQVASQYPDLDGVLRERRTEARGIREQSLHSSESFTSQAAESERGTREVIIAGVHDALLQSNRTGRPFLVVLDTFEEVVQRDLADRVYKWLDSISEVFSNGNVKVVFSGRLYDRARTALSQFGVRASIELNELEPAQAKALLMRHGVDEAMADHLAGSPLLPLRPLELKLLAKLIQAGEIQSVEELEKEIEQGGPGARELFAALVYRRVLLRVGDLTQSIAYPGLVLRYVTKELIVHVLGQALDLPPMTEQQAEDALDALAGYDWLAYRRGDEVWHRKDLRRSMLKAMTGNDRGRAEKVHQAAIVHFERAGTARDMAEALYHRLMLLESRAPAGAFALAALKQAYEHIDTDIADLPSAGSALLRYCVEAELSVDEVLLLPEPFLQNACKTKGESLCNAREFRAALKLLDRVNAAAIPFDEPQAWQTETLFATASWDRLRQQPPAKTGKLTLSDVAAHVFPGSVVDVYSVSLEDFGTLLAGVMKTGEPSQLGPEANTQLERIALCLPILFRSYSFVPPLMDAINRLIRFVKRSEEASPLLSRRLLYLQLLCGRPWHDLQITVGPSTLRLNRAWLESLINSGRGGLVVGQVFEMTGGSVARNTVRGLLGAVSALKSQPSSVPIGSLPTDRMALFTLIAGPDPEFRSPACFALDAAFPDEVGRRQLGAIFAKHIGLPLADLTPDAFSKALPADPEHGMESYVELADRAGKLGAVLDEARQERPDIRTLADVSQVYDTWVEAIRHLCLTTTSF